MNGENATVARMGKNGGRDASFDVECMRDAS